MRSPARCGARCRRSARRSKPARMFWSRWSRAPAGISAPAPTLRNSTRPIATPPAARDYGDAVQDGLQALIDLDRPTIAVLRGNAVGGGLGLALACDLRFCAADAYLAVTPAKLGLVYGHAETRRLVELVGPSRAKDLLFTGRRIETEEALAIGLIDRRVETALQETVMGYARGLAELSQASIRGGQARGGRRSPPAWPSRRPPIGRSPNPRRSGRISPRDARPSPRGGPRNSPFAARPCR